MRIYYFIKKFKLFNHDNFSVLISRSENKQGKISFVL
jgi:hypothetical protein